MPCTAVRAVSVRGKTCLARVEPPTAHALSSKPRILAGHSETHALLQMSLRIGMSCKNTDIGGYHEDGWGYTGRGRPRPYGLRT